MRSWYLLIPLLSMLFSCVNDLEKIQKVVVKNTDPNERIQHLQLFFSDSGYAKVRLYTNLAETFYQPQNITKLKDSLCVFFYDEKGQVETILTGHYGEYYPNENKVIVQNNVKLIKPSQKQVMETEELIWKQADSSIFSNRAVTITTPEGKFYGDGVKTKQDFTSYEFLKPRGTLRMTRE